MSSFPFSRIRHLLIDLDGVLYRGNTPLPDANRFMKWLRDQQIGFRLVSNNSTLTPDQYSEKLGAMSIDVRPGEAFTSAMAAARYLQSQGGAECSAYVVGQTGVIEALREIGIRLTDERPDWVVVGLDRAVTYEKLSAASLAIEAGARFLGTNPDTSFPTEKGLEPGAGAIQAAITATTGVRPIIVGKPEPAILRLAMADMGAREDDTAVLGDRLDTDIAGAAAVHLPSILVLTGVSRRSDLEGSKYRPNLVVDDLAALIATWA